MMSSEDQVEAALHIPRDNGTRCVRCGQTWPCITARFASLGSTGDLVARISEMQDQPIPDSDFTSTVPLVHHFYKLIGRYIRIRVNAGLESMQEMTLDYIDGNEQNDPAYVWFISKETGKGIIVYRNTDIEVIS